MPIRMAIDENDAVEPRACCPRMKVPFVGDRGKLSDAIAIPSFSGSPEEPLSLLAWPAWMKSCLLLRFRIWRYMRTKKTTTPPTEPRVAPRTPLLLMPDEDELEPPEEDAEDDEDEEDNEAVEFPAATAVSAAAVALSVPLAEVDANADSDADANVDVDANSDVVEAVVEVAAVELEIAVSEDEVEAAVDVVDVNARVFWSDSSSSVAFTQLLALALKIHKTSSMLPPDSTTVPSLESAEA